MSELVFSPDGGSLATAGYDDIVHLLNVATGKEIRSWKIDHNTYGILTFSPDSRLIATGEERQIHVWDAQTGKQIAEIAKSKVSSFTRRPFHRTGRILASGWSINKNYDDFNNEAAIKMWEVQTGQETRQIDSPHPLIGSLALRKTAKPWHPAAMIPPSCSGIFPSRQTAGCREGVRCPVDRFACRRRQSGSAPLVVCVGAGKERGVSEGMPETDAGRRCKTVRQAVGRSEQREFFRPAKSGEHDLVQLGESVETASKNAWRRA